MPAVKRNFIKRSTGGCPGCFREQARREGRTTAGFTREVLANPGRYGERIVRRARLANTLSRLRRRK